MSTQCQKAKDNNIQFDVIYKNIELYDTGFDTQPKTNSMKSPIIYSDEYRIKQVLLGLQSNALKFTQDGHVHIEVEIIEEGEYEFIKISVIDTGIGIAQENQDKLFKLFGFVDDNQQMNTNGIGLGLMISKLIVNKFKGNINFLSEPGVGSTFMFTFRLEKMNQDEISRSHTISNTEAHQLLNQNTLTYNWRP